MKISIFSHISDRQPKVASLADTVRAIRTSNTLKSHTEGYRTTRLKSLKEQCPLFAVACLFEGGKASRHITALTGLSLVDIDHAGTSESLAALRQKACADPHTLLCYTTVSGEGLRILFRYQPDADTDLETQKRFYTRAFQIGNDYYARLLGVETDRQCKNVTRLSIAAYDPEAYFAPDATPFDLEYLRSQLEAQKRQDKEQQRLRRELLRIDRCYNDVLLHELQAEKAVYQPGMHNDYVMRVAYKLNQFGFSLQGALQWAGQQFADYDETERIVRQCYKQTDQHGVRSFAPHRTEADDRRRSMSVSEIKEYLTVHNRFRYNLLSCRTQVARFADDGHTTHWQNLDDRLLNSIWTAMNETKPLQINDLVRVIESDFTPAFHPLTHYLDSLPPWDADRDPDYIRQLAETISVAGRNGPERERHQALFEQFLRKWLVGMVAAWVDERVVNNVILVLVGPQGSYKTTWFQHLLPPSLQEYFYIRSNSQRMTRDDRVKLAQYALVCCEELDVMSRNDMNELKAVVTMNHIDERAAYARYHEHRKHIASFCGTGNNAQFINDPTGTRRWLPVEVEHIRSPRTTPFAHNGIFAQAYSLYRGGYRYWFEPDEQVELQRYNARFESPDLEFDLVSLYFRHPVGEEVGEFYSVARVMQIISANLAQKLSPILVGKALKKIGFRPKRMESVRGYIMVARTANEIVSYQKCMAMNRESE